MKMRLVVKVVMVAFVISSCFMISGPAQAQDKVIKLRYSNFFPPAHVNSKLSEEWCKEIEKRTNGRVKISYFPGGTLASPAQTYDNVVQGIIDIGQSIFVYTTGRFPLTDVLNLPLGISSGLQATKLDNAYYKKFHPKEMADTKILYLHGHGPQIFHTRKVIKSVNDIKGLRIKTGSTGGEVVKAFGGIAVTMPIPETYDALQKGLADGVLLPIETLKNWKFADFLRCTLRDNGVGASNSMFVAMNKDKWNSLPKDIQEVFEKVSEEWIEKQGKAWDDLEKDALEYALAKKGFTVVNVPKGEETKTKEKMKPILTEYVQNMKAKGLPGEEALKFCIDWLKANP